MRFVCIIALYAYYLLMLCSRVSRVDCVLTYLGYIDNDDSSYSARQPTPNLPRYSDGKQSGKGVGRFGTASIATGIHAYMGQRFTLSIADVRDRVWVGGKETSTQANMADVLPHVLNGESVL